MSSEWQLIVLITFCVWHFCRSRKGHGAVPSRGYALTIKAENFWYNCQVSVIISVSPACLTAIQCITWNCTPNDRLSHITEVVERLAEEVHHIGVFLQPVTDLVRPSTEVIQVIAQVLQCIAAVLRFRGTTPLTRLITDTTKQFERYTNLTFKRVYGKAMIRIKVIPPG